MSKLAVFVEGLTEQIFVERLLTEIAGENNIQIEKAFLTGGRLKRKGIHLRHAEKGYKYFAYIINCRGDSTVASDIREHYDSLVKAGYTTILGLRDVYPIPSCDIPKLKRGLLYGVKTKPVAPVFVLAIMEIEAWFLAECTHFVKIHPSLTVEHIREALGIDLATEDVEMRAHPSADLNNIYSLARRRYSKRKKRISRTVRVIDYAQIYFTLPGQITALKELTSCVDSFLGLGSAG